jgi:hypothetical protein
MGFTQEYQLAEYAIFELFMAGDQGSSLCSAESRSMIYRRYDMTTVLPGRYVTEGWEHTRRRAGYDDAQ